MSVKFERWGRSGPPFERFGGGWKYKLGFQCGSRCLIVCLLFGQIRVTWVVETAKS